VTRAFDTIADLYRRDFADELHGKPFDRELLTRVARRLGGAALHRPVLEVGAGPAHVGAFLAARGARVVASDVSQGQLREARILCRDRLLVAADLRTLPIRPGSLGAIVAFYSLIYGPVEHLDRVFADWRGALAPDGLAVLAVHAGVGTVHIDEWHGRRLNLELVLRDPDDVLCRLRAAGFTIDEHTVRSPYEHEHQTERLYVTATRPADVSAS
jgi:SAM-dependent methyltransferase